MNMLSKHVLSNFSENRVAERLTFISSSYFVPEAYTVLFIYLFKPYPINIRTAQYFIYIHIYTDCTSKPV